VKTPPRVLSLDLRGPSKEELALVDRVDSGPSVTKEGMSVVAVELHSREQRLSPPDHCDYVIDRSAAKSSGAGLVGMKPGVAQGHFDDARWPASMECSGYV